MMYCTELCLDGSDREGGAVTTMEELAAIRELSERRKTEWSSQSGRLGMIMLLASAGGVVVGSGE